MQDKHHLAPLPAGWFYNGSQYVSMAGEKANTHPGNLHSLISSCELNPLKTSPKYSQAGVYGKMLVIAMSALLQWVNMTVLLLCMK